MKYCVELSRVLKKSKHFFVYFKHLDEWCNACFHMTDLSIFLLRLACSEDVQFFQFDSSGNMYIFPPGSGCTGVPTLVQPGDEMIFGKKSELSEDLTDLVTPSFETESVSEEKLTSEAIVSNVRSFNLPLKTEDLQEMSNKKFSDETMKKVNWVIKMYRDWHNYRHSLPNLQKIECDLDDKDTISKDSLIFALSHFLTEVKKFDGSEFPSRTLYDILICVQFHLECLGFGWKLLNDETFKEVKYTLDNLMKLRTSQGVGKSVRKAQILSFSDEDFLWNMGLLRVNDPDTLLNTVVFVLGKGCALCAGKEHYAL